VIRQGSQFPAITITIANSTDRRRSGDKAGEAARVKKDSQPAIMPPSVVASIATNYVNLSSLPLILTRRADLDPFGAVQENQITGTIKTPLGQPAMEKEISPGKFIVDRPEISSG
jgi:hypothetical protein